jgi:predicted tellurium resistance membrane protein TerC
MDAEIIISLLTLTFLEIILGIDNILFISILSGRLPKKEAWRARIVGLSLAVLVRVALLFCIGWIIGLREPLFEVLDHSVSGRDLILIAGGLFLVAKSTTEIHGKLEGEFHEPTGPSGRRFFNIILQIVLIDLVFSFDSILTAVGLVDPDQIWIMVTAIVISLVIMVPFMGFVARFVEKHPTVKILALAFLLLIGFMLLLDGLHIEVPKGYIYFALFFSMFVELLNIRLRKRSTIRHLNTPGPETREKAET